MSVGPFPINLLVFQGATFDEALTWKAGDPQQLVDLTGCTARAQFRPKKGSPTLLHTMTTENGGIVLGGSEGTIRLHIDHATTAAFNWTSGVWDFELTYAAGAVRRLFEGRVTVSQEVTRD